MPIYSRTKYRTEKLQLVLGQIFAIDGRKSAKYTKERSRGKIVVLKIGFSFPRRTLISQWCGQKMANSYFLKRKAHKYMPISFPCGRKNSYEVYVRVLNSFVKDVKISLISFIGNTGGLMGLYLVLSFLSIFELLNHFIKWIFEKKRTFWILPLLSIGLLNEQITPKQQSCWLCAANDNTSLMVFEM